MTFRLEPLPSPRILSYRGSQDGIRWGDIVFADNHHRRFTHDLITGNVRLYRHDQQHLHIIPVEDCDEVRIAEAWCAVQRFRIAAE